MHINLCNIINILGIHPSYNIDITITVMVAANNASCSSVVVVVTTTTTIVSIIF